MSLFKILDEYQMATLLGRTIAVRIFDEAKLMLVYVTSNGCVNVVPFDELYDYGTCKGVVCIELTPSGIKFSGTDEYCTTEFNHYVTVALRPYARRIYHQDLALEAAKKAVKNDTVRLYNDANSLTTNVGLTESDGYYDTIGERAFFALVEQGVLDVNVAYTLGY